MVPEQGKCDIQGGPCVPKFILEEVHRWLSTTVVRVLDPFKGKKNNNNNKTKQSNEQKMP